MDDSKLVDQMARANRAAQLLDDGVFAEAFDGLRSGLIDAWADTKDRDEHLRERIWLSVHLLDQIKQSLRNTITNGRQAQRDLEQLITDQPRTHLNVV